MIYIISSPRLELLPDGIFWMPNDQEGMRDIMDGKSGLVVLGDKGYVGESLAKEMENQGNCLMALKRSNSKTDWSKPVRQLIFKLRRRVETVFSQLS